jgi:hypothetical protein
MGGKKSACSGRNDGFEARGRRAEKKQVGCPLYPCRWQGQRPPRSAAATKAAGDEVGGRFTGTKRPQGSADSALRYRSCSD